MARSQFQSLMRPPTIEGSDVYGNRPSPQLAGLMQNRTGLRALPNQREGAFIQDVLGKQPNAIYSGSGRPSQSDLYQNRVPQARSREQLLGGFGRSADRMAGTATLAEASNNPAYNADGRFFQGAGLGVNQNGQAYFRQGDQPPVFAGGAATAQEAGARRMASLLNMEQRGLGYVDKQTGAFVGRNARTNMDEGVQGRLAAGGTPWNTATPEQLNNNRLSMLQRMAQRRESALNKVQQMAMESTANRRARLQGPNPFMQMLQQNPQLALAVQQQQNQMINANADRQNRLDVANAEGGVAQNRAQLGAFAAMVQGGMDPNEARRQIGMPELPGGPQGGPAGAPQVPKAFAGGTLTEPQFREAKELYKESNSAEFVRDKLRSYGLTDEQITVALNQIIPPSFLNFKARGPQDGTRTAQDPGGWSGYMQPKLPSWLRGG